jgi:prefoldin subunit 5
MEKRLEELRSELTKGRQRLELLDRERQEVRDTMLRISGAIRVLEELVTPNGPHAMEEERAAANA